MGIQIDALSPHIGARVTGLDLAQGVDDATGRLLKEAFDTYSVLLIRDQKLDQDQLAAAVSWLGTLSKRNRPDAIRRENNPFISLVSNIRENGKLIGSLPDGEMHLHFDATYVEKPQPATFLYAVEIPRAGGNTRYSNMYTAYERVPDDLKRKLDGMTGLQVYDYTTVDKPSVARLDQIKHCSHPIFIKHPVTGRRVLYVSRLMTARINELSPAESDEVLARLFAIGEDPTITYEHVWQPGDFLTWDNFASAHCRTDFSAAERRLLWRGVIAGDIRPAA